MYSTTYRPGRIAIEQKTSIQIPPEILATSYSYSHVNLRVILLLARKTPLTRNLRVILTTRHSHPRIAFFPTESDLLECLWTYRGAMYACTTLDARLRRGSSGMRFTLLLISPAYVLTSCVSSYWSFSLSFSSINLTLLDYLDLLPTAALQRRAARSRGWPRITWWRWASRAARSRGWPRITWWRWAREVPSFFSLLLCYRGQRHNGAGENYCS